MRTAMRITGYYKVRRFHDDEEWSVAYWDGCNWATCGDIPALADSDFADIGERIILPHEE